MIVFYAKSSFVFLTFISSFKVKAEPFTTPIQKIVPVKVPKPKKEAETGFHVYIKTENLKALKMKALQEETSVKDLINRAIEGVL
jgi:hypothetical protein